MLKDTGAKVAITVKDSASSEAEAPPPSTSTAAPAAGSLDSTAKKVGEAFHGTELEKMFHGKGPKDIVSAIKGAAPKEVVEAVQGADVKKVSDVVTENTKKVATALQDAPKDVKKAPTEA